MFKKIHTSTTDPQGKHVELRHQMKSEEIFHYHLLFNNRNIIPEQMKTCLMVY